MDWFNKNYSPNSGGVLAIPTGGGKTFVASRFLSLGPLSKDYKVLWLAHTHHLLEQAFETVCEEINLLSLQGQKLTLRVVSVTKNHFKMRDIKKMMILFFLLFKPLPEHTQKKKTS